MTIQEVINKAVEGGWDDSEFAYTTDVENAASPNVKWEYNNEIFLDPLFWQSLGKALGWRDVNTAEDYENEWLYHWHCLIDHLAEGKTPESFFESFK